MFTLEFFNVYYIYLLIVGLILLYGLYYIILNTLSNLKNGQDRFALKLRFKLSDSSVTQSTIDLTRNILTQIHALAKNEIIGFNISNVNFVFDIVLNSTSKVSLNNIRQAILKSNGLKIQCGDITKLEVIDNRVSKQFIGEFKITSKFLPIKINSLSFAKELLSTLVQLDNTTISITLIPKDYHHKLLAQAIKLNTAKINSKGVSTLSEEDREKSKAVLEKNLYPIFLSKIEIISDSEDSVKELESKFNSLSTNRNQVYFPSIRLSSKFYKLNNILLEFWFSWLMPKQNFYLNTNELAHIIQPLEVNVTPKQEKEISFRN